VAKSLKRLDLCAAQIAHLFHLAGCPSVKGKVCLEVGSGWVLSHAVVLHLLGAKKVVATDILPCARPSILSEAIRCAVPSIVRDTLSPFCEHSEIRRRLNNILSIEHFSFDVLKKMGIEYIAPIDLAKTPLGIPFDFVYSNSVLEHVPVEDVLPLLGNLTNDLSEGGLMIHAVHLEDHKNLADRPFAFLSESQVDYYRNAHNHRENRIRSSQWRQMFDDVTMLNYRFLYEWRRLDKKLPDVIDSSISHEGEGDLRVSHIAVLGTKKQKKQK
jgi:hypothetical protein